MKYVLDTNVVRDCSRGIRGSFRASAQTALGSSDSPRAYASWLVVEDWLDSALTD